MKQDEQIDNFFRTNVKPDFSEEIPEKFLTDINQRLDRIHSSRKKKRSILLWWLTGAFSLIACLLFSFTWLHGDDKELRTGSNTVKKAVIKSRLINDSPNKLIQTKPKGRMNLISNEKGIVQNPKLKESDQLNNLEISIAQFEEDNQIDQVDLTEDISNDDKEKSIDTSNSIFDNSNVLSINENDKLTKMNLLNFSVLALNNGELLKPEARNKNQRISQYAGFYCGISSVQTIFKEFNSPVVSTIYTQKNYLEKRKAEEIGITSWDVSLKYLLNYKGFTMSSGLDYFVWGEKTDYSNVNYSAQFLNKYQYLSVPINLGYSMRIGKYGINPFAGVSVGRILKATSGYYLNSQSISSAFQATASPYTTTFNGGFELSYYSQSGIKVSLMPITRFSVRQVVNTEMVSTNYFSIGLNLGIGYCW